MVNDELDSFGDFSFFFSLRENRRPLTKYQKCSTKLIYSTITSDIN
jgi:hypothetical protein